MAELNETVPVTAITASTDDTGTLVLSLAGEIDIATVAGARAEIDRILDGRAPGPVAFDLSALSFMDSSGLALLLRVAGQTERVERIEIRSPSTIVRRVIEISGLAGILPMTP